MTKSRLLTLAWMFFFGVSSMVFGVTSQGGEPELIAVVLVVVSAAGAYWRVMYR